MYERYQLMFLSSFGRGWVAAGSPKDTLAEAEQAWLNIKYGREKDRFRDYKFRIVKLVTQVEVVQELTIDTVL